MFQKYRNQNFVVQMAIPTTASLAIVFITAFILISKSGLSVFSGYGLGILGALLFAIGFIAFCMVKGGGIMVKDIKELSEYAAKMAKGDIDFDIEIRNQNEFGRCAADFQVMQKEMQKMLIDMTNSRNNIKAGDLTKLNNTDEYTGYYKDIISSMNDVTSYLTLIIKQISEASNMVSSSSVLICGGSQTLAQGATEQAAATEEIASTIESIVEQTSVTNNSIRDVKELSLEINAETDACYTEMQRLVNSMQDINAASGNISKIVRTIDDIAFQTNILSLNAAIEAARVGEAGKGFAVVANEVKNLAEKSAAAAKNISALVTDNIEKVSVGTEATAHVQSLLKNIQTSAEKSTSTVGIAADAVHEQSVAIEQVSIGISQISQVVQSNTATAEESAAASEELSNEAKKLNSLTSQFKIG